MTQLPPSDPLASVAERFKRQRQIERLTQAEIASEIGVTRPLIAHFENRLSRLSFSAGYAFCRRANINPRWLATGNEPQRPFVGPSELGISKADIDAQAVRGVDFLEGYKAILAAPLERWAKAATAPDHSPLLDQVARLRQGCSSVMQPHQLYAEIALRTAQASHCSAVEWAHHREAIIEALDVYVSSIRPLH